MRPTPSPQNQEKEQKYISINHEELSVCITQLAYNGMHKAQDIIQNIVSLDL